MVKERLEYLLKRLDYLNCDDVLKILDVFKLANELHKDQERASGEPYIIHPLEVAIILAEEEVDRDTIIAGLLHDTIEDTPLTKEEIIKLFGYDVGVLVDGVTKMSKSDFHSKQEQNLANTRKIITGITTDVRIIMIKLADRLHNMRTLEFKTEFKQKENALETLEIFVPLAYYIGQYRIKSELEDLAFKYLKNDEYKRIEEIRNNTKTDCNALLYEMDYKISNLLYDYEIPCHIKVRVKNIYSIYKRLNQGHKLTDIHDLLNLKIMVDDIMKCYSSLGLIHSIYKPTIGLFKDYICAPKANFYRSLHTTVIGPENRLVQAQIRTTEMDKIASFGLAAYFNIEKDGARIKIQDELKNKLQFYKSLVEIDDMFKDNEEFLKHTKEELFKNMIYVQTRKGEIIELPEGSTPVDFAYILNPDVGNKLLTCYVNDKPVNLDYRLNNNDRVRIVINEASKDRRNDLEKYATTLYTKTKIKEYNKKTK